MLVGLPTVPTSSALEVATLSGSDSPDRRRGVEIAAGSPSDLFDRVVDPDVDLQDARQQRETRTRQWDLVVAAAAGGVLGAEGRYAVGLAVPHAARQFPWSTVAINASGCLLIGALMVVLLELTSPHRLARPFLGVGMLGGYTTYSTFAVDVERLVLVHRPLIALGYVVVTVLACAATVWLSTVVTLAAGRAVATGRIRRRDESRKK